MVTNWRNWCRLCAREDPNNTHINIQLQNEPETVYLDAISKYFLIDVNLREWPQNICTRCHEYVTEFISFANKASRVQKMFGELLSKNDELDLEELRRKYELGDIKLDIPDPLSSIGEYKSIGEIIKTEQIEEDNDWHSEHKDDSTYDKDTNLNRIIECEEALGDQESEEKKRIQNRKTFACSLCQKQLSSYSRLEHHLLKVHNVTAEPAPTHKITPCPYCEKKFRKNKLGSHIRETHVGAKPFVCNECGKAYTTFSNLKTHKFSHSDESPFKCRYCEKGFKNKPRLKTHEDTHNETNYICSSCGLQLNTRRTLRMHMLVHSDQKRYKCDFCGNEYKRAKALKMHLILHTGLKPYKCNFCDKTFANASNCRSHKKKLHPTELAAMEATATKVFHSKVLNSEDLRTV